jgi:uncharacterized protein (TIRG00374 family)
MNMRRFFIVLGLLAFALIVYANAGRVGEFSGYLGQARWYILIFIVVAQLAGYYCMAKYYQLFTGIFGSKKPLKTFYGMSLALNFVNQAFPSGGVSSLTYLGSQLPDMPKGKITLTHFMRFVFTYISFTFILLIGFIVLVLTGNVAAVTSRFTLLIVSAIIALSIATLAVMSNEAWLKAVAQWARGVLNQLGKRVLRRDNDLITHAQLDRFVGEFHEGYAVVRGGREHWQGPLLYLLGNNVMELLTIYVVFLSFGQFVNPGVIIAGYALANAASILGVFTGGIGIFEATMIATFAALGVPFALSTAVVIVYRVLNLALFLPIGFVFYNKSLKT